MFSCSITDCSVVAVTAISATTTTVYYTSATTPTTINVAQTWRNYIFQVCVDKLYSHMAGGAISEYRVPLIMTDVSRVVPPTATVMPCTQWQTLAHWMKPAKGWKSMRMYMPLLHGL